MEPTNCINIPPNALQPCHSFALLRLTFSVVYDASLIFPVLLSFTPGSTRSYQPSNTKPTVTKYIKIMQNLLLDHRSTIIPPRAATCENVDCSFSTWIGKTQGPRHMGMAIFGGMNIHLIHSHTHVFRDHLHQASARLSKGTMIPPIARPTSARAATSQKYLSGLGFGDLRRSERFLASFLRCILVENH